MEFHFGIWNIPEGDFRNISSGIRCLKHGMVHFFLKKMIFWKLFVKNSGFHLNNNFYLKKWSNKNHILTLNGNFNLFKGDNVKFQFYT